MGCMPRLIPHWYPGDPGSEQDRNESRPNRMPAGVPPLVPDRRGPDQRTAAALAWVEKVAASNTAVPIMVATDTLNGASRRVPARGTSQT